MFKFEKGRQLLKRFHKNEDGNIAMLFAGSIVVVVGCMGAAMDYSTLSNAKSRGQSIADQTALSAAIFVKENDRPPATFDEGVTEGSHSAFDLGYQFKGWVKGGAENVNVTIKYDDDAKEARVTVSGETIPTFIQVLGKQELQFSAESVVSYLDIDETFPASIVMVLDNSGSMRWDDKKIETGGLRPPGAQPRIDSLKTTIGTFREELRGRIGDQVESDGQVILRTGILPYNSEVVPLANNAQRSMQFGFAGISGTFVSSMRAEGSTNSNPPMRVARTWLDLEDDEHRREAQRVEETYREPLKFAIFMTDGQNTSGDLEFVADDTTNRFYAYKSLFGRPVQWWVSRNRPFDSDFIEGRLELTSDRETVATCQAMQAEGTQIFTIGYGLEVGSYFDPLQPNNPQTVSELTQATAFALLSSCASKPSNFIEAGDGDELEGAFDQIQNAIVKELIRIKS